MPRNGSGRCPRPDPLESGPVPKRSSLFLLKEDRPFFHARYVKMKSMSGPEIDSPLFGRRRMPLLFVIFFLALLVRIAFLIHYQMIDTDSAYYGSIARFFAGGHWQRALDPYWPPLFPFFASLLFRLGLSLEAAGIAVSLFASAGLVFICFFLGERLAGTRAGFMAAGLAALHPRLVEISQAFMTEPLYVFFSASALLLFCRIIAARHREAVEPKASRFLALGFLLSLSFLTRPEGFFYFVLIFAAAGWLFLIKPVLGKRDALTRPASGVLPLLLLLAGFLLPSLPYIVRLTKLQGHLTLGEKAEANVYLTYRDEYQKAGIPVEISDYESITEASAPRRPGNYRAFEFIRKRPEKIFLNALKIIPRALLDKIPSLMYWPLLVLSALGLLYRKKTRRNVHDLVFAAWILVPVALYAPLFLYRRFFTAVLPPLIVWCAVGLEELRPRLPRKAFWIVLGLGAAGMIGVTQLSLSRQSWPVLYKEAGLWVKSRAEKNVILAGRKPETSFYAEAGFRPLEPQRMEDLAGFLKKENVTYLVVEDYILPSSHPQLISLLDPAKAPPWLAPVFSAARNGHRLILYRFTGDRY